MGPAAIGFLAAFAALTMGLLVVGSYGLERRRTLRTLRNADHLTGSRTPDLRAQELAAPLQRRLVLPALERLGRALGRLTPGGVVDRLRADLEYAGSPAGWDAERLIALRLVSAVAVGGGGTVILALVELSLVRTIPVAVALTVVGLYLPEWQLRRRIARRQLAIRRALPDSMDLLSITVEAGLGFDAALTRVSRQVEGPLAEEYHRVVKEMQLGRSRASALRNLGERSTVSELRSFVLAMVQADMFGISIADVLHVQASEMRVKRRQHAEEQAQKVPVKILFPLVSCIFPVIFIVLLGPAAIRIYETLLSGR